MTTSPMSENYETSELTQKLTQFIKTTTVDVLNIVPPDLNSSEFDKKMWPVMIKQILEVSDPKLADNKLNLLVINLTNKAANLKNPRDLTSEIDFIRDALIEKRSEYQALATGTAPLEIITTKKVEPVVGNAVKPTPTEIIPPLNTPDKETGTQGAIVETIITSSTENKNENSDPFAEGNKVTLGENEYVVEKSSPTEIKLSSIDDASLVFDVPRERLATLVGGNIGLDTRLQETIPSLNTLEEEPDSSLVKKETDRENPDAETKEDIVVEEDPEPLQVFAPTMFDHFSKEDFATIAEKTGIDPNEIEAWRAKKLKEDAELIRAHKWKKEVIPEEPEYKINVKLKPGTPIGNFNTREEYEKAKEELLFKRLRENKVTLGELIGEEKIQELLAALKEQKLPLSEEIAEREALFDKLRSETGVASIIEYPKNSPENQQLMQDIFAESYDVPTLDEEFKKLLGSRRHDPELAEFFNPETWPHVSLYIKEQLLSTLPGAKESPEQTKKFLEALRDETMPIKLAPSKLATEKGDMTERRKEFENDYAIAQKAYEDLLDACAAKAYTYFNTDEAVERAQEREAQKLEKDLERQAQNKEKVEREKRKRRGQSILYTKFRNDEMVMNITNGATITEKDGDTYRLLKNALSTKDPAYAVDSYTIQDIYIAKEDGRMIYINILLPNGKTVSMPKSAIERFARDRITIGEYKLQVGQPLPEKMVKAVNYIGKNRGYSSPSWTLVSIGNFKDGQDGLFIQSPTGLPYAVNVKYLTDVLEGKNIPTPRPVTEQRRAQYRPENILEKLDNDDSYFGRKTYLKLKEELAKDPTNQEIRTKLNIIYLANMAA